MKEELEQFNNDIITLVPLTEFNYENIFKMYKDGDYFAFNILKKVTIPDDMDQEFFDYVEVHARMAWTTVSYNEYGTIMLWWLICAANKIANPTSLLEPGTVIKIIKAKYVRTVLDEIRNQIKS